MTDKIKVIEEYKYFIKQNKIKLPQNLQEKRKVFIDYFINLEGKDLTQSIKELSRNYLYITTRTIEDILFYNE